MFINEKVSGEIEVVNQTELWYKVYVRKVGGGNVQMDLSNLRQDERGYYFLLPPKKSSQKALPPLNPQVTFTKPSVAVFFLRKRQRT
jgi:hypothetical protein